MKDSDMSSARAQAFKWGFIMNSVIALSVTVTTSVGVWLTGEWYGLWSLLLMLFAVVPRNKDDNTDEAEDEE